MPIKKLLKIYVRNEHELGYGNDDESGIYYIE